jgi:hypothetical protein
MPRLLDLVDTKLDQLNRSMWGVTLLALVFRFLIG